MQNDLTPASLSTLIPNRFQDMHTYNTRHGNAFLLPRTQTSLYASYFQIKSLHKNNIGLSIIFFIYKCSFNRELLLIRRRACNICVSYNTRHSNAFLLPRTQTSLYASYFLPSTLKLWNSLPPEIKDCPCRS
jgi:hypothetical protein